VVNNGLANNEDPFEELNLDRAWVVTPFFIVQPEVYAVADEDGDEGAHNEHDLSCVLRLVQHQREASCIY
jgi:hypothetical protein